VRAGCALRVAGCGILYCGLQIADCGFQGLKELPSLPASQLSGLLLFVMGYELSAMNYQLNQLNQLI